MSRRSPRPARRRPRMTAAYRSTSSQSWDLPLFARRDDGIDDGLVARAASDIAAQMLADFFAVVAYAFVQDVMRHDQDAGRAEAALECAVVDEGPAERPQFCVGRGKPLHRLNIASLRLDRECKATQRR